MIPLIQKPEQGFFVLMEGLSRRKMKPPAMYLAPRLSRADQRSKAQIRGVHDAPH